MKSIPLTVRGGECGWKTFQPGKNLPSVSVVGNTPFLFGSHKRKSNVWLYLQENEKAAERFPFCLDVSKCFCHNSPCCAFPQVMILYFNPSVFRCILLRWVRLMGFAIMYGTVILKLYRYSEQAEVGSLPLFSPFLSSSFLVSLRNPDNPRLHAKHNTDLNDTSAPSCVFLLKHQLTK